MPRGSPSSPLMSSRGAPPLDVAPPLCPTSTASTSDCAPGPGGPHHGGLLDLGPPDLDHHSTGAGGTVGNAGCGGSARSRRHRRAERRVLRRRRSLLGRGGGRSSDRHLNRRRIHRDRRDHDRDRLGPHGHRGHGRRGPRGSPSRWPCPPRPRSRASRAPKSRCAWRSVRPARPRPAVVLTTHDGGQGLGAGDATRRRPRRHRVQCARWPTASPSSSDGTTMVGQHHRNFGAHLATGGRPPRRVRGRDGLCPAGPTEPAWSPASPRPPPAMGRGRWPSARTAAWPGPPPPCRPAWASCRARSAPVPPAAWLPARPRPR